MNVNSVPGVRIPHFPRIFEPVAQWIEHQIADLGAGGSTPLRLDYFFLFDDYWRDGRVVECGGFEIRYTGYRIGGSNPPFSDLLFSDELEVVDDCNCLNPVRTEVAAVGMVTLRLFNFNGAKEFFYFIFSFLITVH